MHASVPIHMCVCMLQMDIETNEHISYSQGGVEVKNHKTFINFVSTIMFFSFPVCRNFWHQIVAYSVCFILIC